jgi:nucleotide-binding universal stress UspA family protein
VRRGRSGAGSGVSPRRRRGSSAANPAAPSAVSAISNHACSNSCIAERASGVPRIAISPAIPSTAPICRKAADTAVPVARRFGGRSITDAVVSPANASPIAVPETSCAGSQSPT